MFADDENVSENRCGSIEISEKDIVRTAILVHKKRIDGRGLADVRQIK